MTSPTEPSVISLHEITKAFPGVVANDRISLDIVSGQVHCLLGENGAGKSTLISILAGMQQPDSGTISIDGALTPINSPRAAVEHGIGVVHQHSTLVPAFTVLENLMLGENGFLLDRASALQRLEELSELLGARIEPHALAADLGLGQQQQVEIAKAMWKGSRLLILDEPTSMLTPQAIEHLGESIERVKAQGLAVVFITHKLREAYAMGDCVTVLRGGRNVGHISVDELAVFSETQAQDAILHAMFGDDLAKVDDAAELAGATETTRETARIDRRESPVRLSLVGVSSHGIGRDVEVEDAALQVHEGEILGIAGIDGHGQGALAEVVAGQRPASQGTVVFDGQDVTRLGVRGRQQLGLRYVTDDRLHEGTVGSMAVSLNLVIKRIGQRPFWKWGQIQDKVVEAEAERLIEEYGIRTPSPSTRAGTLSGGNIQKILLARELTHGARLVIVNKPTYGLDLKTVRLVRELLIDFAANGGSVLLLSTDLDELVELSHRIEVISRGRLVGSVANDGPGTAEKVGQYMTGAIEGVSA
ncbi:MULTISPECIES: ABC transporter ATP-binding protein [unclassified Microbacterium]|uniref:putative B6 ABC transporter ATP-binding protein n=1 Tax=unclassified Microbacterium TaxID=2609290 RepID=UPI001604D1E2|nr:MULTISPECIES: ABC transporter ATP-binding protein [unclassified Microbacterium]QNA91452.1 ABC transporter ATP-binding protein [Microbacterium sp. Se63.02b]QYM64624.1 ABC transporter ATP-binding protein [Microbacterium sp. Se5.02b]